MTNPTLYALSGKKVAISSVINFLFGGEFYHLMNSISLVKNCLRTRFQREILIFWVKINGLKSFDLTIITFKSKLNVKRQMSKRNTQLRRHAISLLVSKQGEVSVDELAQKFETSEVTIRKDLASLEKNGQLLRRYGGAIAIPTEVIHEELGTNVSTRKVALANAAASLIRDHNRIVIDSGSTTAALIQQLNDKRGLVVMTNSLHVANALNELESEPTLLMTGGTWDTHSESFQGKVAESVLRAYDFDQLFIGADGIDLERGTTTFNELVGLSKVMAEVSREVIVMIESEKIGRRIPNLELAWQQVDVVVTDSDIQTEYKLQIEQQGVKVICA